MSTEISQRDNTRNQSTLDIQHNRIFIGDNGYENAVLLNDTGAELTLKPGTLVLRDPAVAGQVIPAVIGATLANVIGVIATDEDNVMAIAGTLAINYCSTGKVDETKLVLPGATTLDTVVAGKSVRDHLNALSLELAATIDNTKYDN